ncbi:MAG: flavodoxin family protein, partial [Coprobacillaceae bacterium]
GNYMTKKVLIISGSPRKNGNSDILCSQFSKGAKEIGHDIETITIRNLDNHPCIACYSCRKTNACFQKDDMNEVLEKMITADIIVLATPVYFYSMDAQMKMLIDRTLPRYTEIRNKDFYFIVTAAASPMMMERTVEGLRGFLDCLPNANEKGIVYGQAWQLGEINGTPAMEEAYRMGLKC